VLHENRQSDTSFSVLTTNNRVTNRVFEYLSSNQKNKIKLIKNVREETNSLKAKNAAAALLLSFFLKRKPKSHHYSTPFYFFFLYLFRAEIATTVTSQSPF